MLFRSNFAPMRMADEHKFVDKYDNRGKMLKSLKQLVSSGNYNCEIVNIKATPVLSKSKMLVIRPKDAITVPPGMPGAPMAKIPKSRIKRIMELKGGICPYNILEMVMTKKVSVNTLPHR